MADSRLENLIVPTSDEARKIGRLGGIASGEERRRRKTIREQLELLLSLPFSDDKAKARLKLSGLDLDSLDNQMAMTIAIWQKALKGDVNAFNSLRDTVGEKPKEVMGIEGEGITDIKIKFVDKSGENTKKEKDPKICGDYTPPTNYKD